MYRGGSMNTINFVKRSSFRKNFFPKSIRVPTEFQLNTWEYEGGCLYGACDDVEIVNGVLCRTWMDKVRATVKPFWSASKSLLRLYK